MISDTPQLCVIVPVLNGGDDFSFCLAAIKAELEPGEEWFVVDDCSSDSSAQAAAEAGARVIRFRGKPRGPAVARNYAAGLAKADILVFIDADVVVHTGALDRIRARFREDSCLAAVFGAYDEHPPEKAWISQYKNLAHRYTHVSSPGPACTFWAGCGAIRRIDFEDCGGFEENFARPSIEDVELGFRMHDLGKRIVIDPELSCTHYKAWTFKTWARTDIFSRAVPWSKLLVERGSIPATLNLRWTTRLAAVAATLTIACLLLAVTISALTLAGYLSGLVGAKSFSKIALVISVLTTICGSGALVVAYFERGLIRYLGKLRGIRFASAALGFHTLHLSYSLVVFAFFSLWLPLRTTRLARQVQGHRTNQSLACPVISSSDLFSHPVSREEVSESTGR